MTRCGLDPHRIFEQATPVERVLILDARRRKLLEYHAPPTWPALSYWISTEQLRDAVMPCGHDDALLGPTLEGLFRETHPRWRLVSSPGILMRRLGGQLLPEYRTYTVIWDGQHAIVGVCRLTDGEILLYAIPKTPELKDRERTVCVDVLDRVPDCLAAVFQTVGQPTTDQWFPLHEIGYRSCWDGTELLWGAASLRLHPLSGQFLSYWAIQAQRLARQLAQEGALSAGWIRRLDHANRQVFWRHLGIVNFYLRPSLFWKAIYRPYTWALRHSGWLRRGAIRRLALT
jgi:hypothetical protein